MPESKNSTNVFAFIRAVSHHWLTLMGGGAITVALGVFERFSGKNVPLWVYVTVLILFVFFACYLAWRDARKELAGYDDAGRRKREYLAERISTLLREAGEVDLGFGSSRDDPGNMRSMFRLQNHRWRIARFLRIHYGEETVNRFQKNGTEVLEELLADCYKDDSNELTVIQKSV